jgi:hypothetical protein
VADKAEPVPVSLTTTNGNGTPQSNDTISIVFSERLSVSSVCSTWSNDGASQTLSANNDVTVTVTDGGAANDTLMVSSATCQLHFGSIDLGSPGFVTATRTFSGTGSGRSMVDWTLASLTLRVTLGSASGAVSTVSSAVTSTYTPDAAIKDTATPQNSVFGPLPRVGVMF